VTTAEIAVKPAVEEFRSTRWGQFSRIGRSGFPGSRRGTRLLSVGCGGMRTRAKGPERRNLQRGIAGGFGGL